ncbi:hypothetical protein P256_01198 [Acinetobacter nectaris CIP 110549]|uniref:Uncharacterized protein n=2 Tax=Acinetobacter nectaris TaxID=1219382 RepID=V2TDE9_9GAMM|nr:hypothetical protein [Acinetobacter nectaris]ESK40743.1 hypothetical protein P256_01198 [Acinetobacter nectaris CIP 110549]
MELSLISKIGLFLVAGGFLFWLQLGNLGFSKLNKKRLLKAQQRNDKGEVLYHEIEVFFNTYSPYACAIGLLLFFVGLFF